MRRCRISPPSCKQPGQPCCKDCTDKSCETRCQNSPARCNCWAEGPVPQARDRKARLDRAEIYRLHELGLLQREIAARLGYSTSGVSAVLRGREEGGHAEA